MKLFKVLLVAATMIFSIMVHAADTDADCKAKSTGVEVYSLSAAKVCEVTSCTGSNVLREKKCVPDVCTRDLSDNRSGGAKLDADGKPIPVGGSDHR